MEDLLTVSHLKKYYAAHKAVDDISFSLSAGTVFGLLGPNGAGKTTLLRMITGILYPDAGDILFKDKPFRAIEDNSRIGYMPEERGLYKKMKVGDLLLYLGQLKNMTKADAKSKALFWVRRFDLSNWWSKKVGDLSKGMQQKVQFISTILHEPQLLILDEPFSGLDPINSNLIKQEIYDLCKKGTTVIFSTHRMEQVEEICKHVVLVNKGKKVLDGKIDEIKNEFKKNEFSITLDRPYAEYAEEEEEEETSSDAFVIESIKDNSLIVKLKEGTTNNSILKHFINEGYAIQSFNEILPSINEVFIELVKS